MAGYKHPHDSSRAQRRHVQRQAALAAEQRRNAREERRRLAGAARAEGTEKEGPR